MERMMTAEAFELLVVCHGPEPEAWPADVRTEAALLYAASADGARFLKEERALRSRLAARPAPGPDDAAFLARLMDIPLQHEQAKARRAYRLLGPLAGFVADSRRLLSPVGIAAQTAAGATVLMAGVMIGMGGTEAGTELDLSASLFASTDLYLEDQ